MRAGSFLTEFPLHFALPVSRLVKNILILHVGQNFNLILDVNCRLIFCSRLPVFYLWRVNSSIPSDPDWD